jgi:hypothetical protein
VNVQLKVGHHAFHAADLNLVTALAWEASIANGQHRVFVTDKTLHIHDVSCDELGRENVL